MAHADPARIQQTWIGPEGLARLSSTGHYSSPEPLKFKADWHAVAVDGVQLAEWRSTAVSGLPSPEPSGPLRLDAVIGGRMQYRIGDATHSADAGSVHLIHVDRPMRFVCHGPMRVARVTLQESALPMWLRESTPVPDGPLPATTLTSGFVALLDRLTTSVRELSEDPPLATAKAVAVLAAALLEEAIPNSLEERGDLRQRIIGYIDRHLGDQDLGPRRIADEFEISLRWVHRVFNQDDESIARYIRDRRVDAIAALLRTERRWVRVGDLAFRFGFAGRDQLTRAFKQRYGMTVNEYLDVVVQGGDLPQRGLVRG